MPSDDFDAALNKSLDKADAAFKGKYGAELKALLGLSNEDLKKISPSTTTVETYQKLIEVVKEASARNIKQAELKQRIVDLGNVAVSIAKTVGGFAAKIGL